MPEPSLSELIDEMMEIIEEDDQPFVYDSECIKDDEEKCECGAEAVGSPRHSSWCVKYKKEGQ
jgi:hypothetical protein